MSRPPKPKKIKLIWQILGIIYAAIFLTILFLAYTNNLPPLLTENDKPAHLVLYCIATYVGHQVFARRHTKILFLTIPLFPFLFGLFTLVEEACQSFSPYRTLDAIDLIASFLGIFLGYWLVERNSNRDPQP
jgi:polysaccharide biosynthesis protein VpsQ